MNKTYDMNIDGFPALKIKVDMEMEIYVVSGLIALMWTFVLDSHNPDKKYGMTTTQIFVLIVAVIILWPVILHILFKNTKKMVFDGGKNN